MTDVNIAVEILNDAFLDKFDVAILISADSDLTAPIKSIQNIYNNKKIICAFPPNRFSFELTKTANAYFNIGRATLAKSIFPETVVKKDGFALIKPESWK